jgi:hypothetical protein
MSSGMNRIRGQEDDRRFNDSIELLVHRLEHPLQLREAKFVIGHTSLGPIVWPEGARDTPPGVAIFGHRSRYARDSAASGELIVHLGWRRAYVILALGRAALLLQCATLSKRRQVAC